LVLFSKWLVFAMTLLGLAGGLFYAWWAIPTYSSQCTVAYTSPDDLAAKYGVLVNVDPNIIQSTASIAKIKQSLSQPGNFQAVEAVAGESTNTLVFTARATSPVDARNAAKAAAATYIGDLTNQFQASLKQQEAKAAALWRTVPEYVEGDEGGKAERDAIVSQYREMRGQIAAASQAPPPATVRIAAQKASLSSVSPPIIVAVGALLGMFLGIAAAVVRNALDTRLRSTASVTRIGETSLGALSDVGPNARAFDDDDEMLPVAGRTANAFTQSIRELRTALQATMTYTDGSMLVITAVQPGVPTGFITANLAASFALSGRRVIVVSGDLRQPTLNMLLMPDGRPRADPSGTVPTRVPNLRVVLPLHTPLDPADFLATSQVRERLDDLRASADLLVMDAPPVLVAADAAIVSAYADATLLVAAEDTTRLNAVEDALTRLRAAGGRPLGVVVASDQVRGNYQAEYSFAGDAGHTTWVGPPVTMRPMGDPNLASGHPRPPGQPYLQ